MTVKNMEIHQFLESFSEGDAIGYHVLEIQKILRDSGIDSEIYVKQCSEGLKNRCKYYVNFPDKFHKSDTKLIYHHSIYSECFEFIRRLYFKKYLVFHNITPPEFFIYHPEFEKMLSEGYQQMYTFDKNFKKALADSIFNKQVLEKYGYRNEIEVIPPFINLEDKFGKVIAKRVSQKKEKKDRLLFVSQFAPHKGHIDLIKAFKVYKKLFNENSELIIVGGYNSSDDYYIKLINLIAGDNNIKVTGKVSIEELKKYYQSSDIFLCMSEHEGFAVPIVESMYFNLPVIAYGAGAVVDTLGKGGIVIFRKNYLEIAAIIDYLNKNKNLRDVILKGQKDQMEKYNFNKIRDKLKEWLIRD